ncbi:hypothetical protein [Pedobacter sp. JY14-1]|uniref:hypothetical protein n=1 Tax=Pedobacter sp. JY14-1 TaxID=3034151 RepID=UPI0023E2784F|nr:hypothetical protein [Pedobacter sp. JY14-1]
MVRIVYFVFFLLAGAIAAFGQSPIEHLSEKPHISLNTSQEAFIDAFKLLLIDHIDNKALNATPKGSSYPLAIALSMDKDGKVDQVYTSLNLTSTIKRFLRPGKELLATMQKLKPIYNDLKNKIVIVTVLFIRADALTINADKEFSTSFIDLWPDFPQDNSKPVILIKPSICRYDFPVRH